MTRQEYAEYEAAVSKFFEAEGINNLSTEGESYFSWRPCECCRSTLGGDRYYATGYNPNTKQVLEYEICADCGYYAAYGQLDDQTMLDLTD